MKPLTPREKQIVRLLSTGEATRDKEIAAALGLAVGTTRVYLTRIYRKTGAGNRVNLTLWALRNPGEIA